MIEIFNIAIKAAIQAGHAILKVYNSDNFEVELKSDNSPLTLADRKAHEVIAEALKESDIPILSEEGRGIPFAERRYWDRFWLVDPLDGTKEFVKRNGEFTVNIALIEKGKPVMGVIYVPVTDTLFFGSRNEGAFKREKASTVENPLIGAIKLPFKKENDAYRVVASRSHMSPETVAYVDMLRKQHDDIEIISKGSSLKLCLVAEGLADIYPRFGPTSEWDTAAGHAIVLASGGKVVLTEDETKELIYNKENILNPYFVAKR
ncbi:MAG: 3'(2'),5'-bisphosphate nucleotidase CysQ [bacterium]|jgi:3'(2'), 5'-bisphosphate nucleotidase